MNALILVDLQYDFMPGGALAVPDGDAVVAVANRVANHFDLVIATQDWHPADHRSFASRHPGRSPGDVIEWQGRTQILWPVHCVQGTRGARLHALLDLSRVVRVIRKGMDRNVDSYSGFFDNARRMPTGLEAFLRERGVTRVHVMGLATDYCVRFTALDARSLGFETCLILDGCRGVELKHGDIEAALSEMRSAGVCIEQSDSLSVGA